MNAIMVKLNPLPHTLPHFGSIYTGNYCAAKEVLCHLVNVCCFPFLFCHSLNWEQTKSFQSKVTAHENNYYFEPQILVFVSSCWAGPKERWGYRTETVLQRKHGGLQGHLLWLHWWVLFVLFQIHWVCCANLGISISVMFGFWFRPWGLK